MAYEVQDHVLAKPVQKVGDLGNPLSQPPQLRGICFPRQVLEHPTAIFAIRASVPLHGGEDQFRRLSEPWNIVAADLSPRDLNGNRVDVDTDAWPSRDGSFKEESAATAEWIKDDVAFARVALKQGLDWWVKLCGVSKKVVRQAVAIAPQS